MALEQVDVRQATAADAAELTRLRWDFSPDEVQAGHQGYDSFALGFAAFLDEALRDGEWGIWVAAQAGTLVANIYVHLVRKVPRPGRFGSRFGYVTNVYVEPSLRAFGVGSQVLRQVITWARDEGLEFLIVWPSEESIGFYERHGFRPSDEAMELSLESLAGDTADGVADGGRVAGVEDHALDQD